MAWSTACCQYGLTASLWGLQCAYQRARSSGTGWSSRRWPRAWPGSSAGAGWGPCPSARRTGWSRLFFSAWCTVSGCSIMCQLPSVVSQRPSALCSLPSALCTLPLRTSPFSSWKTSLTLSPSIFLSTSSEATQPSVGSGCQARVPFS
jgi:hypothetical protein